MNRRILMAAATVAVVTSGVIVACKKSGTEPTNASHSAKASALACSCSAVATTDSTISGQITSDLYLSNTKTYKLSGLVFVTGNHTLTIQEGTRILGLAGSADHTQPGGGLVVTRGSKLNAIGTASCPIVFTSYRYDSAPERGDWAGIVLLGNAPTNNYPASVEGINSTTYPGIDLVYGNATPVAADNSGTLKFVRIEYAGFVLSADNEMNGLTMAGVGSGTTIEYVEVFKSNDDSFEFFGGTVSPKHIISVDGLDDMFDTDNGYTGTISYALGMSDTSRADISQSNGFESDNNSVGGTTTLITHPHYDYVTIIGVPNGTKASSQVSIPASGNTNGGTARYGRAAQLRRNAEFEIDHSIFVGFNYGVSLDGALGSTIAKYNANTSWFKNTYVQAFGTSATPAVGPFDTESNGVAATGSSFSNTPLGLNSLSSGFGTIDSDPLILGLISPFNRGGDASNFFVDESSDAYLANAGAFPGNIDWTIVDGCSNWTRFQ